MYLRHYGFRRMPFDNTPDPSLFFKSPRHSEALAALLYAVRARKGLAVLTGEVGAGKTTVARVLLGGLEPDALTAVLTHTHLTSTQLLQAIGEAVGIDTRELGRVALLQRLEARLRQAAAAGRDAVVVIDEAQNLGPAALEEVRLLSNLETEQDKLAQWILLGQPELNERLDRAELRSFRQRIAVRFHLGSLARTETLQYIEHRLRIAGPEANVRFSRGALQAIYRATAGTPRRINTVCDNALLLGFVRGTPRITRAMIDEVVRDLDGHRARAEQSGPATRPARRLFGRGGA